MKFKLKVPATSANLSVGFDVAGLALNLYNEFTFEFDNKYDGISWKDRDFVFENNLVVSSFLEVLKKYKIDKPKGLHIYSESNIPLKRGLGSSSSCIVAGVIAANIYGNLNLSDDDILLLSNAIEGHPDNVAPCFLGGMVLSLVDKEKIFYKRFFPHDDLVFIALVNEDKVPTSKARKVMPNKYNIKDVIHTTSRIIFLEDAFKNKDIPLLETITKDVIHEPYRKKLIKNYKYLEKIIEETNSITSWISGAGSTVMVLTDELNKNQIIEKFKKELNNVDVLELKPCEGIIKEEI